MERKRISVGLSFDQIYELLLRQHNRTSPVLRTTGGKDFVAEASKAQDGRRFIALPYGNRIYEADWGYRTNSMGASGQWIGHYSIPLDAWGARHR